MNSEELLQQLQTVEEDDKGWISDLRSAWDDEIEHNMSDEKKKFFLLFPSSSEESDLDTSTSSGTVKKNKKIRKHMKTFIKEAYNTDANKKKSKKKQQEVFFGAHSQQEQPLQQFDHVLSKPQLIVDSYSTTSSSPSSVHTTFSTPNTPTTIVNDISKSEFPSIVDSCQGGALVSKKLKRNLLQRVTRQPQQLQYKSESEIIEDLLKYEIKLQKWMDENKLKMNELRNMERNHSKQHLIEMESLIRTGNKRHVKLLQITNIYKYIVLNEKLEYESHIKDSLKSTLFLTKQALAFHKQYTMATTGTTTATTATTASIGLVPSVPKYITDDFFKESIDEFSSSLFTKHLEKKIESLSLKRIKTNTNHSMILKTLLQNIHIHSSLMESIQMEFDQIIGDERNAEGANLKKFFKECENHGLHRIPPREIVEYIESYVLYLIKVHKLSQEQCYDKLLFLTEKFVFDQIGLSLFKIEMENNIEMDTQFVEHCLLLKNLSPLQLGVDPKFLPISCSSTTQYFEEAIKLLQFLGFYHVPTAMIQTIQTVAKIIQTMAHEYCVHVHHKEFSFGADEFFPILVYCCVQSQLPMGHASISFLSKYANKLQTEAEMQYYLTCLEGCLSYIGNISREEVEQLCL